MKYTFDLYQSYGKVTFKCASKVTLITFASRQRPGIFDARQSCVKNNVMIRLSKIVVQLCYTFDANQRWSKPNFREVIY